MSTSSVVAFNLADENTKATVRIISDFVNIMGHDNQMFCTEMTREHRTIQEEFTCLCIEWLKTCASDDYRYDLRNEYSHKVAKKLLEGAEEFI